MNGLAQILLSRGYLVSGSDRSESVFTERLKSMGMDVTIGQREENVRGSDLLIYSAAIKPDNPERAEARRLGIPEIERSMLLGQISSQFGEVVCVSGCHGKTTITSMIALVLLRAGLDATVHIGAHADFLGGGTMLGKGPLLVTEACEYVKSFLELSPTSIILNNIDNDHLDCYKDIEDIEDAFLRFIGLLPKDGPLFVCADDARALRVAGRSGRAFTTYGLSGGAFYRAKNVASDGRGYVSFDCVGGEETLGRVSLNAPGLHNIQNALAATAALLQIGARFEDISKYLGEYRLTKRRFEYYGEKNGVRVFHDYAHHPAEIGACLQGAAMVPHERIFVVFQCNSYTRAKTLFCESGECFRDADEVLVPDIYPGREVDNGEVHAKDMVRAIASSGVSAKYIATFEEIRTYLERNAKPGDIVVTLGSGDVNNKSRMFVE